jgi:hypothetical protein
MTETEIKAAVRKRDKHRCTECGMTRAEHYSEYGRDLEVHRVQPGSPYAVDASCQTLCRRCHGPKPRRRRGTRPWATVRLPSDLATKARAIAMTLRISPSRYLNDLIREAIARDWPKAMKKLNASAPAPESPDA